MQISEFVQKGRAFREKLEVIKRENQPSDFTWYGYDILANIGHINAVLTGENRSVLSEIQGRPIADIGAADGDLAYLFEELGFEIDIIDWPKTNWNGLRGAYFLKKLLASSAKIYEIDLDSYFSMPREKYGLVLFLGILYHLKNPFYVLESIAEHAEFCLLSTRITRFSNDKHVRISDIPVAYLVDTYECNNDATNFWMFSQAGLSRILKRSGWKVLDIMYRGNIIDSDPCTKEGNERAFVFMKSKNCSWNSQ